MLREASSRRWLFVLAGLITLALVLLAAILQVDSVDKLLAVARAAPAQGSGDGSAVPGAGAIDSALRPVFAIACYVIYYQGIPFGLLAVADLAPTMLAPGRIEALLALPIARVQILLGLWLGVLAIAFTGAFYGAGGMVVLLWLKTGIFNPGPLWAALLAGLSFAAIYAAMLAMAIAVRSAAAAAGAGLLLFGLGIVAGIRERVAPLFGSDLSRTLFLGLSWPLPRFSALAHLSVELALHDSVAAGDALARSFGALAFGAAVFGLAALGFRRKDY